MMMMMMMIKQATWELSIITKLALNSLL